MPRVHMSPCEDEEALSCIASIAMNNNKACTDSISSSHDSSSDDHTSCIWHSPNGNYVLIVDPSESAIFTYPTEPGVGLPLTLPPPSSVLQLESCQKDNCRRRRHRALRLRNSRARPKGVVVHGSYAYVSFSVGNILQVYAVNPETGEIQQGCLQELSTVAAQVGGSSNNKLRPLGLSSFQQLTSSPKLVPGPEPSSFQLVVANFGSLGSSMRNARSMLPRGLFSKPERSIRVYDIDSEDGCLKLSQVVPSSCPGYCSDGSFGVLQDKEGNARLVMRGMYKSLAVLQRDAMTGKFEMESLVQVQSR